MNIAAIDIGSNGARLLIKSFDDNAPESSRIRKLLFIRIPLRLGKDVFALGKISKERQRMMMHMMKGFNEFMQLYNVEYFRACATSASGNGSPRSMPSARFAAVAALDMQNRPW